MPDLQPPTTCDCTEALYAREFFHRSANMLQQAIAAVHLVRRQGAAQLDVAMSRLSGMADLNRLLTGADAPLELPDALREIGDAVIRTHGSEGAVTVVIGADPLLVDAAKARPLLMAVAELVANSVRHAFPDGDGSILISALVDAEWMSLTVEDDGRCVGWTRPGGQGQGIVDALVGTAGGTVSRSITREGSSRVTILAPSPAAAATPAARA